MRSAIGQVRGLGSAREGVQHWKMQRLTAIANVILIIWFIVQAASMSGASFAEWQAWFASPYHATFMVLLVVSSFYHAKLGVQVVIEDYIHHEGQKVAALLALNLATIGLASACLISILMTALG
jgi:succinate dehydrogenase / fumarate reductase membrane anchor subunit